MSEVANPIRHHTYKFLSGVSFPRNILPEFIFIGGLSSRVFGVFSQERDIPKKIGDMSILDAEEDKEGMGISFSFPHKIYEFFNLPIAQDEVHINPPGSSLYRPIVSAPVARFNSPVLGESFIHIVLENKILMFLGGQSLTSNTIEKMLNEVALYPFVCSVLRRPQEAVELFTRRLDGLAGIIEPNGRNYLVAGDNQWDGDNQSPAASAYSRTKAMTIVNGFSFLTNGLLNETPNNSMKIKMTPNEIFVDGIETPLISIPSVSVDAPLEAFFWKRPKVLSSASNTPVPLIAKELELVFLFAWFRYRGVPYTNEDLARELFREEPKKERENLLRQIVENANRQIKNSLATKTNPIYDDGGIWKLDIKPNTTTNKSLENSPIQEVQWGDWHKQAITDLEREL